jgi:Uma2 family endonuclease
VVTVLPDSLAKEAVPMESLVTRHSFTVTDYHKMGEAGILGEDDRVELIEGEIVDLSPIGRRHLACVDRLNDLFVRGLAGRAIVRVQGSVILHERSEPQPDFVLLRWRPDFYADADAGPQDVLLIVEVADSSLEYDRRVKVPLYARMVIPETWLVNLRDGSIAAYRDPAPEGYRRVAVAHRGGPISLEAFPDFVLMVDQILG